MMAVSLEELAEESSTRTAPGDMVNSHVASRSRAAEKRSSFRFNFRLRLVLFVFFALLTFVCKQKRFKLISSARNSSHTFSEHGIHLFQWNTFGFGIH